MQPSSSAIEPHHSSQTGVRPCPPLTTRQGFCSIAIWRLAQVSSLFVATTLVAACRDSVGVRAREQRPTEARTPANSAALATSVASEGIEIMRHASTTATLFGPGGRPKETLKLPDRTVVARVRRGKARISSATSVDGASRLPSPVQDLVRVTGTAASTIALAGDMMRSSWSGGFRSSETDSVGNVWDVSSSAEGGGPLTAVVLTRNGVTVATVELTWQLVSGGYLLQQQTARLFVSGSTMAEMTTTYTGGGIYLPPALTRAIEGSLKAVLAAMMPQVAEAQSCVRGILRSIAEFLGLVASAPVVTTGAGAIAWLAGWVVFTVDLIDTATACSQT